MAEQITSRLEELFELQGELKLLEGRRLELQTAVETNQQRLDAINLDFGLLKKRYENLNKIVNPSIPDFE